MAKLKIGSLLVNKREFDGVEKTLVSVALGNMKNKDPKYDLNVEITVKDHTGKIVHTQTNGFINLVDPRTQPDELLRAGIITEDRAVQMKDSLKKLPASVKYSLEINKK